MCAGCCWGECATVGDVIFVCCVAGEGKEEGDRRGGVGVSTLGWG